MLDRLMRGDVHDCEWLIAHQRRVLTTDDHWRRPDSGAEAMLADLDDLRRIVHADAPLAAIADRIDRGRALLGQPPMAELPP